MNPRYGIIAATFAVLPLAACSGGAAATSAAPATSAAQPATSAAATAAATSAPATSAGTKSYTLAEVATHNKQSDCWAAIDAEVYDLTEWISKHPGGPDKILGLCGTDATSAFSTQHDGQAKPNTQLASFKVGDLTD